MHVAGCYVGVSDESMQTVHGAMIQIEETLRLAVAVHIAGIRIRRALLDRLHAGRAVFIFHRRLAMIDTVLIDVPFQFVDIVARTLGYL